MKSLFIKIILLPAVGLIALVLFTFMMLPTESIENLTERSIERTLGGKYQVDAQNLSITFTGNVEIDQIDLDPRLARGSEPKPPIEQRVDADLIPSESERAGIDAARKASEENEDNDERCPLDTADITEELFATTRIKNIKIEPSLTALVFGGGFNGEFKAELGGGQIEGSLTDNGAGIKLNLDGISMQRLPLAPQYLSIYSFAKGLLAQLNGEVDLTMKGHAIDGSVTLGINDIVLCKPVIDGIAKDAPPIPLNDFHLDSIKGAIKFKGSIVEMPRPGLVGEGPDGEIQIFGTIRRAQPKKQPKTYLDLKIRISLSDAFRKNNLLSELDNACKRFSDGFYEFQLKGYYGTKEFKKSCVPARGGASPRRNSTRKTSSKKTSPTKTETASPKKKMTSTPIPSAVPPVATEERMRRGIRPVSAEDLPEHIQPVSKERRLQILDAMKGKQ